VAAAHRRQRGGLRPAANQLQAALSAWETARSVEGGQLRGPQDVLRAQRE